VGVEEVAMLAVSTGHPVGDRVLPAALDLVGAVRDGDPHAITTAIARAYTDAAHPYWHTALVLVLAGLVPDDARVTELLAWTDPLVEPA
jgi:hypothetical protein